MSQRRHNKRTRKTSGKFNLEKDLFITILNKKYTTRATTAPRRRKRNSIYKGKEEVGSIIFPPRCIH
jgi:hypothetical protein